MSRIRLSSRPRRHAGGALVCLALTVMTAGCAAWRANDVHTAPGPLNCGAAVGKARVGGSDGAGMLNLSDRDLTRELIAARDAGMSAVRVDVDWSQIEPSPGNPDWSNTDRVIGAILALGMCPLGLVSYTPMWATNPDDRPTDGYFRPKDPNAFGDFAKAAASRYRHSVRVWEIWNEPNTVTFFKPAPDVATYGALLAAAYRAIKSVSGGLAVISGGLAPAVDNGGDIAPPTFLSGLYSSGFKQYFDGVGMHAYTYPALPNDPATRSWSAAQQMWPMHDMMVAAGDADKQIWITECGAPTGIAPVAVSEAVQAQTLSIDLQAAKDTPWIGPAFVHGIRDSGTDLADPEQNFGILRRDFSPKTAYGVVRQFGISSR